MKKTALHILIFVLLFTVNSVFAQTLYYRNGSIPLTDDTITLLTSHHRGTCQWQCSADGVDWINIEDQTGDSLKVDIVDAGYYRAEIKDETCDVLYSDTALIVTNGSTNITGTFTDRRDGKIYKWVKIGTQIWMAENLAYLPEVYPPDEGSQTVPYYYVYGYEGKEVEAAKTSYNYAKYGVLYNLPAAVSICPSGWHLPNDGEWATLANSLGGKSNAGFKMKSIVGWNSPILNSNNSSGYSALPGGARDSSGTFTKYNNPSANWWSTPQNDNDTEATGWSLYPNSFSLSSQKVTSNFGYSIRCVKDSVDLLLLTITLPSSIDPSTVNAEFPTLKYNKQLVGSWTIDDNLSVWNLHCAINHKPIGGWPNFHLGETGGTLSAKPLEYTDGAGIKHRFSITMGVFDWILSYIGKDTQGTGEWVTPKEIRIMQDFGSTTAFHDLKSTGADDNTFGKQIISNGDIINSMTGRFPKVMIEPNGDHSYITNCNADDHIVLTTAQSDVVTLAKPFSEGFTLNKKEISVKRDFYWSGLVNEFLTNFASQANGTIAPANRAWLIGGDHYISSAVEQHYFEQLDSLYGASGNDILWFPSLDEFYEYWYFCENTTITKTVRGQQISFKFNTPEAKNFFFKSFSVMLSGITDTTGVKVASSDIFNGTSYAINDGKLLVNLDYNEDLISKVEKYITQFKTTTSTSDLEDAQYFTQMLKPGVREAYQDQLKEYVSGPVLQSLSLNAGAESTNSRSVVVTYTFKGAATYYMISEDPNFAGATWKDFVSTISLSLLNTGGSHTVYLKLKNNFDVSSVLSASIVYNKVPFVLNSVSINNGEVNTPSTAAIVTLNLAGDSPTFYKISEKPLLGDATWTPFTSGIVNFTMSSTLGKKTVYVKVKTDTEESKTVSGSIILTEPAGLNSILIDSGAIKTEVLDVKVAFNFKGLPSHYMLSEVPDFKGASWMTFENPVSFRISSEYTVKTIYAKVKDIVGESAVCSAKIELNKVSPIGRKIVFCPVVENADQCYITLTNKTVLNLCTTKQYEEWDNFSLKDTDGQPWATRVAKTSQLPPAFAIGMAYVSPNDASGLDDSGVYPAKYIKKYFGIDGWPELSPAKRGLRILIEPGTYSLNILFSTANQVTLDAQGSIVYDANGVKASPSGIPLNNKQTYVTMPRVVVGEDGILDFGVSQKQGIFAGFNLLEIIRVSSSTTIPVSTVPLDSISINNGATMVTSRNLSVKFINRGNPTHFMLSESEDFTGSIWQTFSSPVAYKLSSGSGTKVLYAKIKDATEESGVVSKTIEYKVLSQVGRKIIFAPVAEHYLQTTYAELPDGTVLNRCTTKQYEDWDNFSLKDSDGEPWATLVYKPTLLPKTMAVQLEYLGGYNADSAKLVGKDVPYPITYMKKYFGIQNALELSPAKSGLRFLIEPGTYTVRVLMSTINADLIKNQAVIIYEANGIVASPSGLTVNNPGTFVELKDVVVDETRVLDFYIAQTKGLCAGFNLLEIVKSK